MGPKGEEEGRPGQAAHPLPLVLRGQGRGGGAPLSSFPLPLSFSNKARGGVLLPVGVGLLQVHPKGAGRTSPTLLYIQGQGGTP